MTCPNSFVGISDLTLHTHSTLFSLWLTFYCFFFYWASLEGSINTEWIYQCVVLHHPYFHLCFLWAAGACVVLGREASLGAFIPAGGPASLHPAETDHLWAAGQEQPAEHRDGRSAAQDRGAPAGQEPPAAACYTYNFIGSLWVGFIIFHMWLNSGIALWLMCKSV